MCVRNRKGFTLIELITVITIIGVLAVVAGPRFFSASTFEDRFFSDDAMHAARYARSFAVAKGCYTRFQLTSTQFQLHRNSSCTGSALSFSVPLSRPGDTSDLYQNTDAPAGTVAKELVFDPRGRAGSVSGSAFSVFATTQTVTIGTHSFQVDGETGFVR